MKDGASRPSSMSPRGLRTGKIRTSKNSASEIRSAVGVRPSEAKVATRALLVAAGALKADRFASTLKDKPGGSRGAKSTKR
jgi:hypothetical protein